MATPLVAEFPSPTPDSWGPAGPRLSRAFTVIATSSHDAKALLAAWEPPPGGGSGRVQRGVLYEDHNGNRPEPFVICLDIRVATRVGGATGTQSGLFKVFASYGYPNQIIAQPPPLLPNGARRWHVDSTTEMVPMDTDIKGKRIENTAGAPFDPPKMVRRTARVLVGEWLRTGTSFLDVYDRYIGFEDAVNSGPFLGFTAPARTALCEPFEIEEASVPGVAPGQTYWRVQARFAANKPKPGFAGEVGGWMITANNIGFREKPEPQEGRFAQAEDDQGRLAKEPVWLDILGKFLPPGAARRVEEFEGYDVLDFNAIP